MTPIVLPSTPLPQSANPKTIDYGAWQEPANGGVITRLDRLGNRFSMDVVLPKLKPEPDGRIWVSRLVQAVGGIVTMAFPQVGLDIGQPGSVVIDGNQQAGMGLALRSFSAGYVVRDGQFFNIFDASGRAYLMQAAGDVVAGGDTRATIPLTQMLRVSPADGGAVSFAPVIQGMLTGSQDGWTLERAGTRGLKFTITETH